MSERRKMGPTTAALVISALLISGGFQLGELVFAGPRLSLSHEWLSIVGTAGVLIGGCGMLWQVCKYCTQS